MTVTVNFAISDEMAAYADRVQRLVGVTRSEILRQAIARGLPQVEEFYRVKEDSDEPSLLRSLPRTAGHGTGDQGDVR